MKDAVDEAVENILVDHEDVFIKLRIRELEDQIDKLKVEVEKWKVKLNEN